MCWPANGQLPSGTTHFLLHVQLRRLHAPITLLRIQKAGDYGQDVAFQRSVNLQPDSAGYGEWYIDAPVNTSVNNRAGWNEYRVTANVGKDEDGERQYQSTGWQGRIDDSDATYRKLPWNEVRAWYEFTDYLNLRSQKIPPTSPVSGNYTLPMRCLLGAGGHGTITYHSAEWGADTHAIPMVRPHIVLEGPGGYDGSVTFDTTDMPNGLVKILLRCDVHVSQGTTSVLMQQLLTVDN